MKLWGFLFLTVVILALAIRVAIGIAEQAIGPVNLSQTSARYAGVNGQTAVPRPWYRVIKSEGKERLLGPYISQPDCLARGGGRCVQM